MVSNGDQRLGRFADKLKDVNTLLKDSKGISSDIGQFSGSKKSSVSPDSEYETVLDTVLGDPEIRAFISIARDAIIRSGFTLLGSKSGVKTGLDTLKRLRWRKVQKRVVSDLLIFKHAFVEIVKNKQGNKVMELHVLDPSKTKPVIKENGSISFWYQPIDGVDKKNAALYNPEERKGVIVWELDELAHYQIDEMSPKFWGKTDIETLNNIILLKKRLMHYIDLLFKQNWFRVHFHGKNVNEDDYQNFIDMFITNINIPDAPLLTAGMEDLEGKRYVTEEVIPPLLELKRELRTEILTLLRIPPIIAGTVDNSNRSNSDVQAHYAFENRIRAVQEDIEDDTMLELFPKIGLSNVEYSFDEISNRSLKEIVEVMRELANIGADKQKLNEWARKKGYSLPEDLFPEPVEMEEQSLPPNSPDFPSRKPQDNANTDGYKVPK